MSRFSVLISPPFQASAYEQLLAETGKQPAELFVELARPVVSRYFAQTKSLSADSLPWEVMLKDLWIFSIQLGHPSALKVSEMGKPGDPHAETWATHTQALIDRWKLDRNQADLVTPVIEQLLLTILLPEFKACRQSYLEKEPLGDCIPRQEAEYCRERISGSHCEDCPYFTALSAEKHRKLLERSWESETSDFSKQVDVFLPDDFRFLRVFLHLHRRRA